MSITEEITQVQSIAHYLVHLMKLVHFGDVSFAKVEDQTGVPKTKAIKILNMFADEGLIDFDFAPWTPWKKDTNYYTPETLKTGYFTFVSNKIKEQESSNAHERIRLYKDVRKNYTYIPQIKRRIRELSEIADSESVASELIKKFEVHKTKTPNTEIYKVNGLTFNTVTGDLTYKGRNSNISVDTQIYKTLKILMSSKDNVVLYADLLGFIFNSKEATTPKMSKLYKIINNLKKELTKLKADPEIIKSTSKGYRLKI